MLHHRIINEGYYKMNAGIDHNTRSVVFTKEEIEYKYISCKF